ncbi:hypothetical protein [Pseudohongiella acticola]|uniref:hypothetical protein n=1 Tax=Pseudohongiella acticola TaxID=1524254 RepID=UPI0014716C79|nr:hypothetical protein [Pseudohongiella acticola]
MFISTSTTTRQRNALSTVKPVLLPVAVCWASATGMPVRYKHSVRIHEMKLGVCPT